MKTHFHRKDDSQIYAEDVPLSVLAKEFGTPSYIYCLSTIKAQYETLSSTFAEILPKDRQPLLCYACKANSNKAILSALRSWGAGLEIVSGNELVRGVNAGFDPDRIVFTGVGKTDGEIEAALKSGIHQINVESIFEISQINEVAKKLGMVAKVVFRLNPDVSGGGHSKISTGRKRDKFGLSANRVVQAYDIADTLDHIDAVGLSMHIGSQVFEVSAFERAFRKLPELVQTLRGKGHNVSRLDIGGGFPIQYSDESLLDLKAYAEWVRDIIVPLETEIIMEPGRFLVGNAGGLLTRVISVKETDEIDFLITDGAMNDLIRPTLYDAFHGIEAVKHGEPSKTYSVTGPVCESGDMFGHDRKLPDMVAGDLCLIKSAGAYGFCMASNYNSRVLPAEILVYGDKYQLIRPRQTLEDILNAEKVPEWVENL
ncbi:MAG: diaminopimelate decarboxylase [Micavibrio sp.]|nr:diaminopimelate decarboxylase [Micavibrio sp.]